MERDIHDTTDQPLVATSESAFHCLEEWYAEYAALDTEASFVPTLVNVNWDPIDAAYIEDRISLAALTTNVSDKFCNHCVHLFSHWPTLGSRPWAQAVGRHCHTAELEAATRQGCISCSFLLGRLKDANLLDTFRRIEKRLDELDIGATASISVQNWTGENQLLWLNFPAKITTHCNSWCALETGFRSRVVPPSCKYTADSSNETSNEGAAYPNDRVNRFEMAEDWLHTCSEHHRQCSDEVISQWPTRLLCIANDAIKLILTVDLKTMPQYATLSYCWGTEEFLKLTPDTFDTFFHGVSLEALPNTFKDAILVARKLHLQYIWIDAMCIVQGGEDHRDWLRESGSMRSVYGGSFVNIAATAATSVQEGLFSMPPGFCGGFLARVQSKDFDRMQSFHVSDVYERSTTYTHLASRAWALQEKLLAPRTIYFGNEGLFWQCRSVVASEFLPTALTVKRGSQLAREPHEAWDWSEIVCQYSAANLSNTSDKLPALSGIARRQNEVDGDEYLAGMWRKRLVKQLGWVADDKVQRPIWRAPSWSWTSVDGQVSYWSYYKDKDVAKEEFVQVLDVSTSLAGPDPYGAVNHGELHLACNSLARGVYEGDETAICLRGSIFPVMMDSSVDDSLISGEPIYLLPLFGGESGARHRSTEKDRSTADAESAENSEDEADEKWRTEMMIRGMVLQRDGPTKGCFRRIGAFDYRSEKPLSDHAQSGPQNYYEFLRVIEEVGASTAESECTRIRSNDDDVQTRYVFTIV